MKKNMKHPQHSVCFQERPLVVAVRHALPYLVGFSLALTMVQTASSRSSDSAAAFTATQLVRQFTLKNTVSQVSMGMQGYVAEVNGQQRGPAMGARPTGFPSDMGSVPATVNLPRRDGAGRPLGYCAWDNSSAATTADYNAGQGVSNPLVYAVVSPGLNGTMQTTCANVLASGAGVGDDHVQVVAPMQVSSVQYKSSVGTFADLPPGEEGDIRLVRDTNKLYSYVNGAWAPVQAGPFEADASGGAGAIAYTTGKVTVADFQAATASITGALSGSSATFTGAVTANTFTGNGTGLTDLNADNFSSGVLGPQFGGTGVNGAAAANGTLLIGNGSGFSLGALTEGSGIDITGGAGTITINNSGVISLAGTANQVNVSAATGAVTLSLPQDIATTSMPTFAGMMLNGGLTGASATFSGAVTADSFVGDGSGLTNLNTANITTGVLPVERGGTGLDGSAAPNGSLLIGNGTGYTLGTLTAGAGIGITNGAGTITLINTGVTSLAGTANQVNVSAATGAITLSLPQDIATTSTPTFAGQTLTGALAGTTATFSGAVTANSFSGNGSALTNLNASNLTTGTVSVARGGTGLDGSAAPNGSLLIGNGTGYTLGMLTAGTGVGIVNGAGTITISNTGVTSLAGTANQVNVSAATGAITLSLPQDIATTSTPTFAGAFFSGNIDVASISQAGVPATLAFQYASDTGSTGFAEPNLGLGTGALAGRKSAGNVAIGMDVLGRMATLGYYDESGTWNTGVGYQALYSNDYGDENTAVGYKSLYANTEGYYNTAIGSQALLSNTTGVSNTANGAYALSSNTTGSYNSASGAYALSSNTTGGSNTASGYYSLYYNATGVNNTASGYYSLFYTRGSRNTGFGYLAGINNSNGSNNTFLGNNADANTGSLSFATAIGSNSNVATSNTLVLGRNSMADQVVIGTNTRNNTFANTKLYVNGVTNLNGDLRGTTATFTGAVSALSFSGNGAALINLNASNLTTGTVPVARGGTGLDGSAAANGSLLIGNGTGYTLGTLTAGTGIGIANGAGTITLSNTGVTSLAGTANQVSVSAATGAITLSLPQNIATTSTPTFAGQTLTGALTGTTATFSGAVTVSSLDAQRIDVGTITGLTRSNLIVGKGAMAGVQSSSGSLNGANTALGIVALNANTSGYGNTASGYFALNVNTTGYDNTANGAYALQSNTTGFTNTANGAYALANNTIGSRNASLGINALLDNVSGNRNIAFGAGANVLSGALDYAGAIGASSLVGTSNTIVLGALGSNKDPLVSSTDDQIVIGATSRSDTFANTKLYVNGVTNLNGDLRGTTATFSGNSTVGGTLGVTGATTVGGNFTVAGTSNLNGPVRLAGGAPGQRIYIGQDNPGGASGDNVYMRYYARPSEGENTTFMIGTDSVDVGDHFALMPLNGNVGIGTVTPVAKLDVVGSANFSGNTTVGGTLGVTGATALTGALTANGGITSTTGIFSGAVTANSFSGNGSALTNLNANNFTAGTLPVARGGTGLSTVATNGQLLIGNGTGYTLGTLTGTANQVNVTNGAGTITLSLPQAIATTSTPTFGGMTLNGEVNFNNVVGDKLNLFTSYGFGVNGNNLTAYIPSATQRFSLRTGGTYTGTEVFTVTGGGLITSTGGISTTTGTFSGNTTVGGTLDVTGATTLTGALSGTTASFSGNVVLNTAGYLNNTSLRDLRVHTSDNPIATFDHLQIKTTGLATTINVGGADNGLVFRVGNTNTGNVGDQTYNTVLTLNANQSAVFTGAVTANSFAGNGAALTNLNAGNISTGTLAVARGGTGLSTVATNGQLLIGNGTGYTLGTLTGTANQVNVTNGAGTITLSLPQAIATTSTPTFGGMTLNGEVNFNNVVGDKLNLFTSYGFGVNGNNLTAYIPSATQRFSLRTGGTYTGTEVFTVTGGGLITSTGGISTTTGTFSGAVTVSSLVAERLDVGTSAGGVGDPNVIVGIGAMPGAQSGLGGNVALGVNALNANTSGGYNVATGWGALQLNTSGTANTASGAGALFSNTSGQQNSAFGRLALFSNTTGTQNSTSGFRSGFNNTTGLNNTFLGAYADSTTGALTYATAIGSFSTVATSNTLALGRNSTVDQVVIGTNTRNDTIANTKLYVNGPTNLNGSLTGTTANFSGNTTVSGVTTLNNSVLVNNSTIAFNNVDGDKLKLWGNFGFGINTSNINVFVPGPSMRFSVRSDGNFNGAEGFSVTGAGNVVAQGSVTAVSFTATSDRRLKQNITAQNNASVLDRLEQLQTYSYDYINTPSVGRRIGVIAQEIQGLFPEAVSTSAETGMMSVDYNALGAMAAMGVGQLNSKFKVLDGKVNLQGEKLLELDGRVAEHNTRIGSLEGWKTEAVTRMDGMQGAIDLNIQKIAENAVAIQTNSKAIERLDDALFTLDGTVKGNTESIANINARWARNFTTAEDGSSITVNAVELKVSNFTAQQVRTNSVYTQRLEAEIAKIAELEVNNLRANTAVANTVQAEQLNTGSVQVYAGVGLPAILFAAKADGHYTVSTSSLDGSYATATVIVNAGQAKVVSGASEGIELVAEGNMVKAIAAGKSIKASWIKMG